PEHFGSAANIPVVLVQFLQDVIAFIRASRLVKGGKLGSRRTAAPIAINQRRQVLAIESHGGGIHYHDAFDHVAQFTYITGPGITHERIYGVVSDFARPTAISS